MRRRALGRTGLEVAEVGFGGAGFWARPAFSTAAAIDLVRRAVDLGMTFFDTGASYGRGESERRLGRAFCAGRPEGLVIATKAGTELGRLGRVVKDFTPAAVRRSVEGSLRRLKQSRITLLHLHDPRPDEVNDELLDCLAELKRSGMVEFCGINGYDPELVRLVIDHEAFDTMMFDYNVFHVDRKDDIDRLAAAGKGFIASTPLAQGHFRRLPLVPRRAADLWYLARAFGRHRDAVRRGRLFRFVGEVEGWTGAEVAMAYALRHPRVAVAVSGTTRAEHLATNVAAAGRILPREVVARIEVV